MPLREPILDIRGARLSFGDRTLWQDFDLQVFPGEFIAILGPNGSGKTSLLRALLREYQLDAGDISLRGKPLRAGDPAIGYVPQQQRLTTQMPLRGKDLVGFGVDGARWGIGWKGRGRRNAIVADALAQVDATDLAAAAIANLSGGEQQRLRIAQALVADPSVLLCDEPLLSLDPASGARVTAVLNRRRQTRDTAILFVTHEINPILPYVDRVVYLVGGTRDGRPGQFRIGSPDEVMTTDSLSDLYRAPVEVLRTGNRIIVIGADDTCHHDTDIRAAGEPA